LCTSWLTLKTIMNNIEEKSRSYIIHQVASHTEQVLTTNDMQPALFVMWYYCKMSDTSTPTTVSVYWPASTTEDWLIFDAMFYIGSNCLNRQPEHQPEPDPVQAVRPGVQVSAQHGSWIPGRPLPTCLQHRQPQPSTICKSTPGSTDQDVNLRKPRFWTCRSIYLERSAKHS